MTVEGHTKFHDSMYKIYSKKLNPDGDNWCGTMCKLNIKGQAHFVITEHQLVDDVCVKNNGQPVAIGTLKDWKPLNDDSLLRIIPASCISLKGEALPTNHPPAEIVATMFVTIDPLTEKEHVGTSESYYDSSEKRIVHSVTTRNYSCGSLLLWDNKVIGIHNNTSGPSVHGSNNKCLPLF